MVHWLCSLKSLVNRWGAEHQQLALLDWTVEEVSCLQPEKSTSKWISMEQYSHLKAPGKIPTEYYLNHFWKGLSVFLFFLNFSVRVMNFKIKRNTGLLTRIKIKFIMLHYAVKENKQTKKQTRKKKPAATLNQNK